MLTIENPNTFDWKNISLADCCEGNCYDTYFTLKLFNKFEGLLGETERWKLYRELISPVSDTFLEMEYEGQDVNPDVVKEIGKQIYIDRVEQEDLLLEMKEVRREYNLNSSKDQARVLFLEEDGFKLYPPKFTDGEDKDGNPVPSTDKDCFDLLLEQIEMELEVREDA
jgi:DNA polymerase I-like protein with 3'-5' exonuclease and polymerase domains